MKKYVLVGVGIFCFIFLYLLYSPPDTSDFPECTVANINTLETDICLWKEIEYFGKRTNTMCEMKSDNYCFYNACKNIDPDLCYEDAEFKECIESGRSLCEKQAEEDDNSSCITLVKGRQDDSQEIQTIEICDQRAMLLYKYVFQGKL